VSLQTTEILLVEDNPRDAELALHAFQRCELSGSVHLARDGQEALDYLLPANERPIPRVILLDLKLPKLDGLDVLRAVRANDALRRIPVVILTSSREERDIIDSYELGVNSYIVKPIDFEGFVQTLGALGFYWLLLNEPPVVLSSAGKEAA
jgi:two-component system, response regulator